MTEMEEIVCLLSYCNRNDSQKRAALLHLVGDEVQDIFETLAEVGTTYEQAITKLDIHSDNKKNIPFERCVFHEAGQESGENIDSYVTKLKKLIIHCEYGDAPGGGYLDTKRRGCARLRWFL